MFKFTNDEPRDCREIHTQIRGHIEVARKRTAKFGISSKTFKCQSCGRDFDSSIPVSMVRW